MSLFHAPINAKVESGSKKDFSVARKFMCRICFKLAIGPKVCACKVVVCSECCDYKARWNENGTKKYLLLTKPHLVAGSDYKARQKCEGPLGELSAEEQEIWSKQMVFRCIYRCPETIPYADLENHVIHTCPFRPKFCVLQCGNYRLYDPET